MKSINFNDEGQRTTQDDKPVVIWSHNIYMTIQDRTMSSTKLAKLNDLFDDFKQDLEEILGT